MNRFFTPITIGKHQLSHRIVHLPLTRLRATTELSPSDEQVKYYRDRATKGGLVISEATIVSPSAIFHGHVPGIWTDHQVRGWEKVVNAVQSKGGVFAIQIWHMGRCAHPSFTEHPLAKQYNAKTCVSSSTVGLTSKTESYTGEQVTHVAPTELSLSEIKELQRAFVQAARNAVKVGALAEIHAAHGYIFDQFLNDQVNLRTDMYGGTLERRIAFAVETIQQIINAVGWENVAIRVSPHTNKDCYVECTDTNPDETYTKFLQILDEKFKFAYILLSEPTLPNTVLDSYPDINYKKFKAHLRNSPVICAGGFTPQSLQLASQDTEGCDGIGFGRWFISNPDLVFRLQNNLPLTEYDRKTFYTPTNWPSTGFDPNIGYNDYPTFDAYCTHAGYTMEEVLQKRDELLPKVVQASDTMKYPLLTAEEIGLSSNTSQRRRLHETSNTKPK